MQVAVYERPSTWQMWASYVRHRWVRWLVLLLLFLFSLIFLAPLVWAVATSLRLPADSFKLPPQWIPTNPRWENYTEVFELTPFATYVVNSLLVTLSCVIGQLFTSSLAGYAFGRLKFPGRELLFWLVLATMMIPIQATIIPVFVLISQMKLADTLIALILPALPTAFGTFLLRQYFLTIPDELEEAALIDGANYFQVFWKIHLPLVQTGLAVQAILSFNFFWNEFFRPLIFLTSKEYFTLPVGLVDLRGYFSTGSISVVLAGVVMSLIPVLIIFLLGQRYLIEGIMRSGIKG
ncbi:MAG: carbohydrate ABC transporter permease [Chloroflexota bacterium]